MIRRQFIKLATLTGATGLAALGTLDALENKGPMHAQNTPDDQNTKTVTWRVHGFTCVTCALGLQVMLQQQKGVQFAQAAYPGGMVTVQFRPDEVSVLFRHPFCGRGSGALHCRRPCGS
jgi:anaerobic selenocysteine-containing dehydrogenase